MVFAGCSEELLAYYSVQRFDQAVSIAAELARLGADKHLSHPGCSSSR